jgi:hypothetical protein
VSNLGLHEQLIYNHHFLIEEGVMAEECGTLMTAFFRNRRG